MIFVLYILLPISTSADLWDIMLKSTLWAVIGFRRRRWMVACKPLPFSCALRRTHNPSTDNAESRRDSPILMLQLIATTDAGTSGGLSACSNDIAPERRIIMLAMDAKLGFKMTCGS